MNKIIYSLFLLWPVTLLADHVYEPTTLEMAGRVLEKTVYDVPSDLMGIIGAPFQDAEATVKYALLIGGLVLTDKITTKFYQKHIENNVKYRLPDLKADYLPSGFSNEDAYLLYGVGTAYLGSMLNRDHKGQATALLASKAIAYSYLFSHIIGKTLTGRDRPHSDLSQCGQKDIVFSYGDTCDHLSFGNQRNTILSSDNAASAFPSFHATLYFSVARVYQQAYGDYWWPYSIATLLFASNIKGHHHWVSDLVVGGLIGTLIGDVVTENYFGKDDLFSLQPVLNSDNVGLAVQYQF